MVIRTGTRLLVSSCSRLLAMTAIVAALGCGHPDSTLPPEVGPRVPAIVVERADPLPTLARELLSPRMHRNTDHLAALHAAVLSVDHGAAGAAVHAILAEPRLARPVPDLG